VIYYKKGNKGIIKTKTFDALIHLQAVCVCPGFLDVAMDVWAHGWFIWPAKRIVPVYKRAILDLRLLVN
jgi:hypothetical protein